MRVSALLFLGASITAILAGCGSAEPGTSTITGTIDQASFPVTVESITVISDSSAPTTAAVASDSTFTLTLLEGSTYRFMIGEDSTIPLILRTDGDRLQTQITITGGDAKADIGSVRFWDGSAATEETSGFTSAVAIPSTDPASTDACVDGFIPRTNQPCATEEAPVECVEREGGGRHHGGHRGGHGDGDGDHAGRPMGGDDVTIVDDPATDASPRQTVAIPERTIATGIGCGGCPGM